MQHEKYIYILCFSDKIRNNCIGISSKYIYGHNTPTDKVSNSLINVKVSWCIQISYSISKL